MTQCSVTSNSHEKLCIAAGGTGGHVFPAIALAKELDARGQSYVFLTDKRGIRYFKDVSLAQSPIVMGFGSKGSGIFGTLRFAFEMLGAVFTSLRYVRSVDRVIGFSGFPCFPPLVAGLLLRKALFIHEQNAVLGKVNRLMGRFTRCIFTSTDRVSCPDNLESKLIYTGMPVRPEFEDVAEGSYVRPTKEGAINIVVVGGSQGASIFSEVIPRSIALLPEHLQNRLHICQQIREDDHDLVTELYAKTHCASLELVTFIANMPDRLAKAHFMISRSGASTISEIQAVGCPTLFVPYPYATDDHQTKNAEDVSRGGGAWIMSQSAFQPEPLARLFLDLFMSPKKLLFAAQQVKKGYLKSRIKILADLVFSV